MLHQEQGEGFASDRRLIEVEKKKKVKPQRELDKLASSINYDRRAGEITSGVQLDGLRR